MISTTNICDRLIRLARRLFGQPQPTYTLAEAAEIALRSLGDLYVAHTARDLCDLCRLENVPLLHWFSWHLAGNDVPIYGTRWEIEGPRQVPVPQYGMARWLDDCESLMIYEASLLQDRSGRLPVNAMPFVWRDLHVRREDLDRYITEIKRRSDSGFYSAKRIR